jgi:hypothetical protein
MPPPLTPEGERVVPLPEKTMLEKYWMYGVAALIAISKWSFFSQHYRC